MNQKNRTTLVATLAGAALVSGACVAHALTADRMIVRGSYELVVTFQDQNLGPNTNVKFDLRAERTATWGCYQFMDGRWVPDPDTVRDFTDNIQRSQIVRTTPLGEAEGRISTDIPQSDFICPTNTRLRLGQVRYNNIQISSSFSSITLSPIELRT
jgi:hypothetical protein